MGDLDHIAREIGSEIKRIQDDLDSKIQVVEERTTDVEKQTNNLDFMESQLDDINKKTTDLESNVNSMYQSFRDTQKLLALLPEIQKLLALLPEIEQLIDLHRED